MMARGAALQIEIRDLNNIDDFRQLNAVEREVWEVADDDVSAADAGHCLPGGGEYFRRGV